MYKRILVPVDGNELTDRAIEASIELARQLGAAITGFVAEPLLPVPPGPRPQAMFQEDVREHDEMTTAHAQQVLDKFAAAAAAAGVTFEGYHDQVPRCLLYTSQAGARILEEVGCVS